MSGHLLPTSIGACIRHGFSSVFIGILVLITVQPSLQTEEVPLVRNFNDCVGGNISVSVEPTVPGRPNFILLFNKQAAINVTFVIRRNDFRNKRPLRFFFDLTSPFFRNGSQMSFKPTPAISIDTLPFSRDVFFNANQSEYKLVVPLAGKRIGRRLLVVTAREWLITDLDVENLTVDPPLCDPFRVSGGAMVWVLQSPQSDLAKIFTFITIAGMALNILAFAVRLHTTAVRHHLLHPFPVLIGMLCQCAIMPTISYLIGLALNLPTYLKYALLVIACSPGGGTSNFVTVILNGDLHMSVLMTCFSNLLSIGIMPLWLYTLGKELLKPDFPGYPLSLRWDYLVGLGVLYCSPAFFGALFRHFVSERNALKTSLWIRLIATIIVLVGIGGLVYNNLSNGTFDYLFEDWRSVVAASLLCHISYIVSFLLAFLGRRSVQARLTIAIEAGFQSTITAQLIGLYSFIEPESIFLNTMTLVYFINIIGVTLIALFVIIFCGLYRGPDGEPLAVEIGYDTSPEAGDEYSISKDGELKTSRSSIDLTSVKDNIGLSTSGSFASLTDVW